MHDNSLRWTLRRKVSLRILSGNVCRGPCFYKSITGQQLCVRNRSQRLWRQAGKSHASISIMEIAFGSILVAGVLPASRTTAKLEISRADLLRYSFRESFRGIERNPFSKRSFRCHEEDVALNGTERKSKRRPTDTKRSGLAAVCRTFLFLAILGRPWMKFGNSTARKNEFSFLFFFKGLLDCGFSRVRNL